MALCSRHSAVLFDWNLPENTRIGTSTVAACSLHRWEEVHMSTCDRREKVWRSCGEHYDAIVQHDWFGSGSVMVWGDTDFHMLADGTLTAVGVRPCALCWALVSSCGRQRRRCHWQALTSRGHESNCNLWDITYGVHPNITTDCPGATFCSNPGLGGESPGYHLLSHLTVMSFLHIAVEIFNLSIFSVMCDLGVPLISFKQWFKKRLRDINI